ncbi:MAG: nicotinate (nicotinamide) nucleotide adenylyltransferase [Zetaproteobacteria bacterium]|nr:MAG: nicotinate (nicotinamide) nucleotide adenylyltransferase [Zetaproteobacteria bacterium]
MRGPTIGLLGGSFDPPHLGHQALAAEALDRGFVDEVWFVPVGTPVHRTLSGCADAQTRCAWLKHLASVDERCRVWDWEVRQNGPVPAIATLREFARAWTGYRAAWLMGADALEGLCHWIGYPGHRDLCDLVVFDRAGVSSPVLPTDWQWMDERTWPSRQGYGHGLYCKAELPKVSATTLRRLAALGESLAGLVPETIRQEVERHYRRVKA